MRVAAYTVPSIRLYPRLVHALGTIYTKFGAENIPSIEALAQVLKHKTTNSGTFLLKLACLRSYGLLQKRDLAISELGIRLVSSRNSQEKNEALKEAVLNVPLYKEFYDRWGSKIPETNFLDEFIRITGLDGEEADRIAPKVKKAYLEDIRHIDSPTTTEVTRKPEVTSISKRSKEVTERVEPVVSLPSNVIARVAVKDSGIVDVYDVDTYKIAMSLMELVEKKLTSKSRR